ncbi:hypothetical protein S83_009967 [Arachis hypogaea]
MSHEDHSSKTRSRNLYGYNAGEENKCCTFSSGRVRQPKKKKFMSLKCHCGSYAILFQSCTELNPDRFFLGCPNYNAPIPHCKYFKWLDVLVHENIDDDITSKNAILMERRLKEVEHRMKELEMELNLKNQNKIGSQGGRYYFRCFRLIILGIISIIIAVVFRTCLK